MKSEKSLESLLGLLEKARSEERAFAQNISDDIFTYSFLQKASLDIIAKRQVCIRLMQLRQELKKTWVRLICDYTDVEDSNEKQNIIREIVHTDNKVSTILRSLNKTDN